jgi:cobalt-zinc-cadmium efflux system membrane fusion protein
MNKIKRHLVFFLILISAPAPASELSLTPAQLAGLNLKTALLASRESQTRLNLNGVLAADRRKTHRVAPVVDGTVSELEVVEHDRVRKGQVLARLRSHSLGQAQADYLEALARFDLSQAERARIEGLWKDGVVSESRRLAVDSEFKSARAALEARRRLLSLAGLSDQQIGQLPDQPDRLAVFVLVSPADGIVTGVEVESGQLLSAGQTAFHVDDLSSLWAMVKIPVAGLPQVKVGAEAMINVQAAPGRSYRGRLESLGGEVDAQSQTLTGRVLLDNTDGRLRPGMYAEVGLSGITRRGVMAPAGAVFRIGDQAYLFKILGKGRFEPVTVEIGAEAEGWVPIHRGIEAGAEVVSEGVAELKSHWQYQGGE